MTMSSGWTKVEREREVRAGLFSGAEAIPLEGVSVEAHLKDFAAKVTLSQRYVNRESHPIEAVYVFPLDEGAAVCSFEAVVDSVRVTGQAMEREKAFERYDDAMAAGHGAYLLDEERADVFTVSVGNLPPGKEAFIRITTVAEMPSDGDDIRFTLPTTVSPRYAPEADRKGVGQSAADALNPPVAPQVPYGLDLTVTLEMPCAIRGVESPTHPLSFELDGSRGTAALLAFLPRLGESASRRRPCEAIFLVDRSGSMGGTSIQEARNALQLCLRSLDAGSRFNVVGFGSMFQKLFPESRPYDDASLAEATRYVAAMDADLGGTEILPALEAVLSAPAVAELPRQVFLLTDGEEAVLRKVPVALTHGWGGMMQAASMPMTPPAPLERTGAFARPTVLGAAKAFFDRVSAPPPAANAAPRQAESPEPSGSESLRPVDRLVALQRADGSWELTRELANLLGLKLRTLEKLLDAAAGDPEKGRRALATSLALRWLNVNASSERDEWALLAAKAQAWLDAANVRARDGRDVAELAAGLI